MYFGVRQRSLVCFCRYLCCSIFTPTQQLPTWFAYRALLIPHFGLTVENGRERTDSKSPVSPKKNAVCKINRVGGSKLEPFFVRVAVRSSRQLLIIFFIVCALGSEDDIYS